MITQTTNPVYSTRNLQLANAQGTEAGLNKIKNRMRKRKDCPHWLLFELDDLIFRSNCTVRVLKEHLNDVSES